MEGKNLEVELEIDTSLVRKGTSKAKKGTGLRMNTKVKIEERVQRLVMVMGKGVHPRRELMAALGLRQESRRNFYGTQVYRNRRTD